MKRDEINEMNENNHHYNRDHTTILTITKKLITNIKIITKLSTLSLVIIMSSLHNHLHFNQVILIIATTIIALSSSLLPRP